MPSVPTKPRELVPLVGSVSVESCAGGGDVETAGVLGDGADVSDQQI